MYRVESLKLFGDISKVYDKYKSWHLKDDENEIKDNRKLKTLLNYHNSTVKAVMFATIDELSLINESIRKKDYLENKNLYFNIYENVALNAFITFLSLRDMNIIKQEDLNDLSQAIFTQIQSIAISSI